MPRYQRQLLLESLSTVGYWPGDTRQTGLAKGNPSKCLDPPQLVELQIALRLKEFPETLRENDLRAERT